MNISLILPDTDEPVLADLLAEWPDLWASLNAPPTTSLRLAAVAS